MKTFLSQKWWKHLVALGFIIGILSFYSVFVIRYADYPWWHSLGQDGDAVYPAQATALVNDGKLDVLHHPGVTPFVIHGATFRILSLFSEDHQQLMRLKEVKNMNEGMDILGIATKTGRSIVLFEYLILTMVLYGFLYFGTKNIWVSFASTFFIVTTVGAQIYLKYNRPEVITLFLFFGAFWWLWQKYKTQQDSVRTWLVSFFVFGMMLALAVLAKIQIVPAFAILVVSLLFYFLLMDRNRTGPLLSERLFYGIAITQFVNIIIFPWWMFKRPEFITERYLRMVGIHWKKMYGMAPESFIPIILLVFLALMIALTVSYVLFRKNKRLALAQKVFTTVLAFTFVITGVIFILYAILVPVSMTFEKYMHNSQHMMYSVMCNIFYGGFLTKKEFGLDTFARIWGNGVHGQFLGINLMVFVIVSSIWSAVSVFLCHKDRRQYFLIAVWLLGLGLLMDIAATLRHSDFFKFYAIYSVCFYGTGIAFWMRGFWLDSLGKERWRLVLVSVVSLFFVISIYQSCHYIFTRERPKEIVSKQNPRREFQNVFGNVAPFREIVKESIERNQ